jgi:hypothetical protein
MSGVRGQKWRSQGSRAATSIQAGEVKSMKQRPRRVAIERGFDGEEGR